MSLPIRIRLQLTCEVPPPAVYNGQPTEFGLQDKQQILYPGTLLNGALHFDCEVEVKPHGAAGVPDFGGSFVHGPAGARFLYLGWRPPGGTWIKRFKIPLVPISWQQIEAGQAGALGASVSAIRSGTVTLLGAGWVATDG